MPSLPEIPGKGLIAGTPRRTRVVVGAAGAGALAVGAVVAKRVLEHAGRNGDDDGAAPTADPIAETPTAPPGAEQKPVPKPKAAEKTAGSKPKPAKPKAKKPKAKPSKKPKAKPSKPSKPA